MKETEKELGILLDFRSKLIENLELGDFNKEPVPFCVTLVNEFDPNEGYKISYQYEPLHVINVKGSFFVLSFGKPEGSQKAPKYDVDSFPCNLIIVPLNVDCCDINKFTIMKRTEEITRNLRDSTITRNLDLVGDESFFRFEDVHPWDKMIKEILFIKSAF